MRYLDKRFRFTLGTNDNYRNNWEHIFGEKCETCGMLKSRHTDSGMVWTDGFKNLVACSPIDKSDNEE